jgi:hypothetical protein
LRHVGEFEGVAATGKTVNLPFAITTKFKEGSDKIKMMECTSDYDGLVRFLGD